MRKNKLPRRPKQATPLTPKELERLKRRRPLLSKEAMACFELEGKVAAIETTGATDTADITGVVTWGEPGELERLEQTKGRRRTLTADIIVRARAELRFAVKADPSKQSHQKALLYVTERFKDYGQSVPTDSTLNRWIIWPVIGKTRRRSHTKD